MFGLLPAILPWELAWVHLSLFMLGRSAMLQPSTKHLVRGDDGVFMSSFIPHLPGLILSL